MLDGNTSAKAQGWGLPVGGTPPCRHSGNERHFEPLEALLVEALNEMDHGVLLVDRHLNVHYDNSSARRTLHAHAQVLRLERGRIAGDPPQRLRAAVADALERGLRTLVELSPDPLPAAVVPLHPPRPDGVALLSLARPSLCARLTLQWFSRRHGLTPGEARVLEGLCEGLAPSAVARRHKVALSTVRTQVASIRAKVGVQSIDALLHRVAVLPPLTSALRLC